MRNTENTRVVCQSHDPDIWHDEARQQQAVKLCRTGSGGSPCPAIAECLDVGTDPSNDSFVRQGVWGGVGPRGRALIRARRARERDRYPTVTFPATDCRTPVTESSL